MTRARGSMRLGRFVLAVVMLLVLMTAVGAQAHGTSVTAIARGDTGWKYKQVTWGADSGFESPTYDDASWAVGQAGFGTASGGCSWNTPTHVKTNWAINSDLLIRKEISLPAGAHNLRVFGDIDNDATVYVNGVSIGYVRGGHCAKDLINVTAADSLLLTGSNVIAIRGHDYGFYSFLDVTVTYDYEAPTDTTAPSIALDTPANGVILTLNQQVYADYTCTDEAGGSGIAACDGTTADGALLDTSSIGTKTFSVDAADNAGNSAQAVHTYIVAYAFSGFSAPVDSLALNVARAGQAIPLKWRITDAHGVPVTTLASVAVSVASLSCDAGQTSNQVDEEAAGSSGLQNLGDGYYQFNWKTPKTYAGSCKTLKLALGDDLTHTAAFQFTN
ncbi:hypothetical protein BH23CHL2_BH23CHL2_18370 [soil metagenome]